MTKFILTLAVTLLLVFSAEARPQVDGESKRQGEDPGEPEDVDVVRTIVTRATVTTAEPNATTSAVPSNLEAATNTPANQGATDDPKTTIAAFNQETTTTSANQPTTAPAPSQRTSPTPLSQEVATDQATTATSVNVTAGIVVSDIPTTAAVTVTVAAASATQVPLRR